MKIKSENWAQWVQLFFIGLTITFAIYTAKKWFDVAKEPIVNKVVSIDLLQGEQFVVDYEMPDGDREILTPSAYKAIAENGRLVNMTLSQSGSDSKSIKITRSGILQDKTGSPENKHVIYTHETVSLEKVGGGPLNLQKVVKTEGQSVLVSGTTEKCWCGIILLVVINLIFILVTVNLLFNKKS